jgi:hypothetical protein
VGGCPPNFAKCADTSRATFKIKNKNISIVCLSVLYLLRRSKAPPLRHSAKGSGAGLGLSTRTRVGALQRNMCA